MPVDLWTVSHHCICVIPVTSLGHSSTPGASAPLALLGLCETPFPLHFWVNVNSYVESSFMNEPNLALRNVSFMHLCILHAVFTKGFRLILWVWMFCLPVCMCTYMCTCMCLVFSEARRGCPISWSWHYRSLWYTLWAMGLKPSSTARVVSALNS